MSVLAKLGKTYVFLALTSKVYVDPAAQLQFESCPDNQNLCDQRSCYNEGNRCAAIFLII
jgi:hypothetical protein